MTFYVYLHARPGTKDHKGVFYVGKGSRNRALEFVQRNPHHRHVIEKYGRENIVVLKMECASEQEAFAVERELIADLRDCGAGYKWPQDKVEKHLRGNNHGLVGERHGMFGKGHLLSGPKHPRFGKPCPENVREALRRANAGKTPWNKGKSSPGAPRSAETKARISASRTGMRWIKKDGAMKCVSPESLPAFLAQGWTEGRFLKKQQAAGKENHAISE